MQNNNYNHHATLITIIMHVHVLFNKINIIISIIGTDATYYLECLCFLFFSVRGISTHGISVCGISVRGISILGISVHATSVHGISGGSAISVHGDIGDANSCDFDGNCDIAIGEVSSKHDRSVCVPTD